MIDFYYRFATRQEVRVVDRFDETDSGSMGDDDASPPEAQSLGLLKPSRLKAGSKSQPGGLRLGTLSMDSAFAGLTNQERGGA